MILFKASPKDGKVEVAKHYISYQRLARKHGKAKALSILAHKLGRAVYFILKNKKAFNQKKFLSL